MSWWEPSLSRGSSGPAVVEYQEALVRLGLGPLLSPWGADGDFGNATHGATVLAQKRLGLLVTGVADAVLARAIEAALNPVTLIEPLGCLIDPSTLKRIQARNYRKAARTASDIWWVVLHSIEGAEASLAAENTAAWFAGKYAPMASAHLCVDCDSAIECVRPEDIAYHAPGANKNGYGIEHAGYARQTPGEWDDAYSRAMLRMSARLGAWVSRRSSLPVKYVDAAGLRAGIKGFTTHRQVSLAFGKSTHTDPGIGFPMARYLGLVSEALAVKDA